MSLLRVVLFFVTLVVVSARYQVLAQDDFGQILLQAFTTGIFDGEQAPVQDIAPTVTPLVSASGVFPGMIMEATRPQASSEVSTEFLDSSPEASSEQLPEETPSSNPLLGSDVIAQNTAGDLSIDAEPSSETLNESESSTQPDVEIQATSEATVQSLAEPSSEMSTDPSQEEAMDLLVFPPASPSEEPQDSSSSSPDDDINGVLTFYQTVRVNCGSSIDGPVFKADVAPWFSSNSLGVEDPFANAYFSSTPDALLYSTYRYSFGDLTYTVPLETKGIWRLTLHWAEISPKYMREGARILTVTVNEDVVDPEVDVFRDSLVGSFSPLVRAYEFGAPNGTARIVLGRRVGDPMLSAFQLSYVSPS